MNKLTDARWKQVILLSAAIFVIGVLLYVNTLQYGFLKDDFRLIVENPRVKSFEAFKESIGGKFFAFPDFPYLHYWRPLTLFTFYADYKMWGMRPAGFHFTNIVLNALNGVLIFLIFYFVTEKVYHSFFIGLFFSLHPSHVEAVTWISGRTDLLASFFIFAAMLFFIVYLKKNCIYSYAASVIFFILGLLSKENAVLFPLVATVLVIIHTAKQDKSFWESRTLFTKRVLAAGGIFFLIDIIYIFFHHRFSGVGEVVGQFSFGDLPYIFKTAGVYAKVILTPFFRMPYFSMQEFDGSGLVYHGYFMVGLVVLALVVWKRKEYASTLYGLLFFIFLLPVLDPEIVPSYPKIVIRFAYIPAVFAGAFLLDSLGLIGNKRLKVIFSVFLVLVGGLWMVETLGSQVYFKGGEDHYGRLVKGFPEDGSLLLPLALQEAGKGNHERALELVNGALASNEKDRWMDVSELGGLLKANLLTVSGRLEEGKWLAEDILESTKKDEMKYFACLITAKYYEKKQALGAAVEWLKKAQAVGETPDLLIRMTMVYGQMGDIDTALDHLEQAKKLNPQLKGYERLKKALLNARRRNGTDD